MVSSAIFDIILIPRGRNWQSVGEMFVSKWVVNKDKPRDHKQCKHLPRNLMEDFMYAPV